MVEVQKLLEVKQQGHIRDDISFGGDTEIFVKFHINPV